jgi:hypothetical protein
VLRDRSRWGNDGTFGAGAAAPSWVQLPSGAWALSFDGDDLITASAIPQLSANRSFSVLTFFKSEDTGASKVILRNSLSANDRISLWLSTAEYVFFEIYDGATTTIVNFVVATRYTHIAAVLNSGTMKLYTNGVDTTNASGSAGGTSTAVEFRIGQRGVGSLPFAGTIGKIYAFDYPLSQPEISAIYESERRLFGV